ncbi:hypothetical protein XENOCAPTIV_002666 [Xenoophorus captivus]|uniref:Uncharacterized protein n=1 Tax=Xenoophorus captivus TaxID=1517983 RepID=A0ABV0SCX8_9TELE
MVNGVLPDPVCSSPGSPQGYVLSPLLFILYTSMMKSQYEMTDRQMNRSRTVATPHREESVEMARASVSDASWMPPLGGVPDTSHREEAQGMAQNTLEGLCLLAGLGMPWAPPSGAGGGVWVEGRLVVYTRSAASTTRARIKRKMTRTGFALFVVVKRRTAKANANRLIQILF